MLPPLGGDGGGRVSTGDELHLLLVTDLFILFVGEHGLQTPWHNHHGLVGRGWPSLLNLLFLFLCFLPMCPSSNPSTHLQRTILSCSH